MPNTINFPRIMISVEREEIETTTIMPRMGPDPKWRFIDKQGHGHFWDGKDLPTLKWVVTGKQWIGDDYGGEEYDVGEYRCQQCAEVIKPGKTAVYEPPLLGPPEFTVTIDNRSFVLSSDQYERAVERWAEVLREIELGIS